jgi:hypothetical protein
MNTRGSILGLKRSEREAGHSLPGSAEVNNASSYTFTPRISLEGLALNKAYRSKNLHSISKNGYVMFAGWRTSDTENNLTIDVLEEKKRLLDGHSHEAIN